MNNNTMKIIEISWVKQSAPSETIDKKTIKSLNLSTISSIQNFVNSGFDKGLFNTTQDNSDETYSASWKCTDVSGPLDLYNNLVKNMKADICDLINLAGVDYEHVQDLKVLDIVKYDLVIDGYRIQHLSDVNAYSDNALAFNLCILETDLELVLKILEDIRKTL